MRWLISVVLVAILCASAAAQELSLLTDTSTSMLKARLGLSMNEQWLVGPMACWYTEDIDEGSEWGFGVFAKYLVNPDGSIPVADLIPGGIGSAWLDLPESIPATTYLILPEIQAIPLDDNGVDLIATFGVGVDVGAFCLEYDYHVVESGGANNPILTSGPEVWLGARWQF